MIAYFDTSAVVKLLVAEPGTVAARDHWNRAARVLSSVLVLPETLSALAAARRSGRMSQRAHRAARAGFDSLWEEITPVACDLDTVRLAGQLAERDGLRGCDSVHLASALIVEISDLVFVAWDRDLTVAARRAGLAVAA
jgi:uncharacterized protein